MLQGVPLPSVGVAEAVAPLTIPSGAGRAEPPVIAVALPGEDGSKAQAPLVQVWCGPVVTSSGAGSVL